MLELTPKYQVCLAFTRHIMYGSYLLSVVYSCHNIEHVNKMVQVNCLSMLAITNLILPIMEAKGKGAMIFMSSSSGVHETPYMAIYSATKAFIWKFAEALSGEV